MEAARLTSARHASARLDLARAAVRNLFCALFCALSCASVACAPRMPEPDVGPRTGHESLEEVRADWPDFEEPPLELDPAVELSRVLLQGPHHVVRSIRVEPGFIHTYVLDSAPGPLEVRGRGLLRERIHELEMLGALAEAEVTDGSVYALSVANAAVGPVEGTAQLLLHPIKTTTSIPRGIWAMGRGFYEMTDSGRSYLEDDYYAELMGFGKSKREWAYRLGVDPYTDNPYLRAALDRYGWLSLAGGMTVRLPLIAVPGGASIALTVGSQADDMKRELRDKAPEDIRIAHRRLLQKLGIEPLLVEQFLHHPWYSPTRQVVIVSALASLGPIGGIEEFIARAAVADEPREAYVFTRLALMLAHFHAEVKPLAEILVVEGFVLARTRQEDVVLPLYVDHAWWTPRVAEVADEIEAAFGDMGWIRSRELLVSGSLSPRARRELVARSWTLTEQVEDSWLAEFDERAFAPGAADSERVLPEIGG